MTYKKAGVNVKQTNAMVKNIKLMSQKTNRNEVIGKIGNFSGFFKPNFKRMKNPILVASTDGVGTKLMVAEIKNKYSTVGIDLVAMCVNDVIACGAEPLLFLDYFATGKVKPKNFFNILKGIVQGCRESRCSLIGGEIAEMPGFYNKDKFDLAGFCVGIVDKKKIIDGTAVKENDIVLGFASSGLHSNGYSLARKLFSQKEIKYSKWGNLLLKPTIIYVKPILSLLEKIKVKSIAHITGGGLYDNIPRVIPRNKNVTIDKKSWPIPEIFIEMKRRGGIDDREMFRTFNMGIGMTVIIDKNSVAQSEKILKKHNIKSWVIGRVNKGKGSVVIN